MKFVIVIAVVVIIVAAMGISFAPGQGIISHLPAPTRTVTFTGFTEVAVGSEIVVQSLVLPSSTAPSGTIQCSFLVTSSISGPWEFSVTQKGTQVFPPFEIGPQWPPPDYTLPSYLSIQFVTENPTSGAYNTTVILNLTTIDAPKGTTSLELVVFQQQNQVLAETEYPFDVIVE